MVDSNEIAAALRQIARGFEALARAVAEDDTSATQDMRYLAALRQWGDQGLTREQATRLLGTHGFAPQTVGGWARGDWIETRDDGLRYLTARSHRWLAEQADNDA
jgi:hypothetical protein